MVSAIAVRVYLVAVGLQCLCSLDWSVTDKFVCSFLSMRVAVRQHRLDLELSCYVSNKNSSVLSVSYYLMLNRVQLLFFQPLPVVVS